VVFGSSLGMDGVRDRHAVRLFAQSPWPDETPPGAAIRRTVGGENDTPPRELARFVREAARKAVPKMNNFVFGVHAVDRAGNRSVVTFPVPET
jgi:hypothetical protein